MSRDWIIHYVSNNGGCACCDTAKNTNNPSYYSLFGFANAHTHGLNNFAHRELCVVLDIGIDRAGALLNAMGDRIAKGETTFTTNGVRTDVLGNGMPVSFMSFTDDPTLYVLLPDAEGRLPGDNRCELPYALQEEYAEIISKNKDYV